ncbi:hypothetical protein GH714_007572 [Hevea brasiliensis]|uniref:Aluminum-activated malate transporter n=1 Tax=Hevea brasiliensis TaxID=3981 RepID=A0A6A6L9B1_HEVBR|nr:hypothetical protein GH714_007572 [Hevea brasiliensis]
MAHEKKATSSTAGVEWRINVGDGSSKLLVQEAVLATRAWLGLKGTALTVVSLFYYLRPLYEGFGGNAMWAIMTVVVVFENTVGATIYKSLNRVSGTSLAGLLAFSVHWVASSAATFSRFIPSVKQNFDYGAMIFILTFSLVAVSGYRVEKLFELAHERLSTIIIGISSCFLVSMLICPIWAGQELFTEEFPISGCVAEYFSPDDSNKNLLAYKCVLSSKASEESMANFARWEPPHGCFSFKHPWKQYPKIGAAMRNCAYCIEALSSCIDSETQAPEFIKKQLSTACQRVSSNSSSVITELAETIKSMKRSCNIDFLVEEMNSAVEELQQALKSLSKLSIPPESKNITETPTSAAMDTKVPLMEVMPVVTFASLLIEISSRIKGIVKAVEQLANVAEFKVTVQDKCNETQRQQQTTRSTER